MSGDSDALVRITGRKRREGATGTVTLIQRFGSALSLFAGKESVLSQFNLQGRHRIFGRHGFLRALTQAGLEKISKALQGTDISRILVGDTATSPYFQVQRLEF